MNDVELKFVRRQRWVGMLGGPLFFAIGVSLFVEGGTWGGSFFCAIGILCPLLLLPRMNVLLRGYAMRDELDTRGAEPIDVAGIRRGVAAGVAGGGLVALSYDWLARGWNWVSSGWSAWW